MQYQEKLSFCKFGPNLYALFPADREKVNTSQFMANFQAMEDCRILYIHSPCKLSSLVMCFLCQLLFIEPPSSSHIHLITWYPQLDKEIQWKPHWFLSECLRQYLQCCSFPLSRPLPSLQAANNASLCPLPVAHQTGAVKC